MQNPEGKPSLQSGYPCLNSCGQGEAAWCCTPICSSQADKERHTLFNLLVAPSWDDLEKQPKIRVSALIGTRARFYIGHRLSHLPGTVWGMCGCGNISRQKIGRL